MIVQSFHPSTLSCFVFGSLYPSTFTTWTLCVLFVLGFRLQYPLLASIGNVSTSKLPFHTSCILMHFKFLYHAFISTIWLIQVFSCLPSQAFLISVSLYRHFLFLSAYAGISHFCQPIQVFLISVSLYRLLLFLFTYKGVSHFCQSI